LVGPSTIRRPEVVDRQRAMDEFGRIEELDGQDRIRLFGAVTAAIWLGHHDRSAEGP
jgi:hypothetical protein